MIISFIILPAIFNFYLIPKIEKRINEKLQYNSIFYKIQIFSRWFYPPLDIGVDIFIKYCIWKITHKLPGNKYGYNPKNPTPLMQAHYDISKASKLEIISAFFVIANTLLFFFLIYYLWFVSHGEL
jgi:hypothetical protein